MCYDHPSDCSGRVTCPTLLIHSFQSTPQFYLKSHPSFCHHSPYHASPFHFSACRLLHLSPLFLTPDPLTLLTLLLFSG